MFLEQEDHPPSTRWAYDRHGSGRPTSGGAMTHVRYIDKTRDYYRNEGYDTPYRWAHFDEIPG